MKTEPETYHLSPTSHAPNSTLPILIYRDCLPLPVTEETTTNFLESHDWVKKGTWGHIPVRHFHPNTHECYGIFQGSSTVLLGLGSNDTRSESDEDGSPSNSDPTTNASTGLELDVQQGDVIVLPAGTAHCNLRSTKDYRYIGVYPKGAPQWRNELGKQPIDLEKFKEEINAVALPGQDPVCGEDGPLRTLWADGGKI